MKRILNYLKDLFLWLWQFPQNISGVFLELLFMHNSRIYEYKGSAVIEYKYMRGGMSLGNYIFVKPKVSEKTVKHEYGHCIQSLYLGPLYLMVIGIPSLAHCGVRMIMRKFNVYWDYYSFYTEKWANKLGEVK